MISLSIHTDFHGRPVLNPARIWFAVASSRIAKRIVSIPLCVNLPFSSTKSKVVVTLYRFCVVLPPFPSAHDDESRLFYTAVEAATKLFQINPASRPLHILSIRLSQDMSILDEGDSHTIYDVLHLTIIQLLQQRRTHSYVS
jgi:hypothetical protein